MKFKDFQMNSFLMEEVEKAFFYKEITNFPKGVIHHLHRSASFFMGDIMSSLENLIDENYLKNFITSIIKGNLYLPDLTRPGNFYKIPSPRLLIITDFLGFLEKFYTGGYKRDVRNFKENYVLADGRCILDPISPSNADNYVDPNVKAFYIFKICRNSVLYSKNINENLKLNYTSISSNSIKPLSDLTEFLKIKSHILNIDARSKKYFLPESYRDLLFSLKDQDSVAVWFKFEMIFGIYSELFENNTVFDQLNKFLLNDLINDKVIGVEFRQKYDMGKPNSRMQILRNMTYTVYKMLNNSDELIKENSIFPVSFILPGRKIRNDHKLKKLAE